MEFLLKFELEHIKTKVFGRTLIKMGVNIIELYWITHLSKLIQKGMVLSNLMKVCRNFDLNEERI